MIGSAGASISPHAFYRGSPTFHLVHRDILQLEYEYLLPLLTSALAHRSVDVVPTHIDILDLYFVIYASMFRIVSISRVRTSEIVNSNLTGRPRKQI